MQFSLCLPRYLPVVRLLPCRGEELDFLLLCVMWTKPSLPTLCLTRTQKCKGHAGNTTAPQLVGGIVELLHKSSDASSALSRGPAGHPLYKTLFAHPSAAQQLLACFGAAFAGPGAPQAASASAQWLQWEPFVSLALLDHGEGEAHSQPHQVWMQSTHVYCQHSIASEDALLMLRCVQGLAGCLLLCSCMLP